MTPNVVTIHRTDSISTACALMAEVKTRHLVVVNPDGAVAGILSDRDCNRALQSPFTGGDPTKLAESVSVDRIMNVMPHCIDPQASPAEAAEIMLAHNISALPVIRDETLIGIVTTTDLLKTIAAQPV
jgi:acetoin utilization protein AcuB